RTGWVDLVALRYAVRVNGLTALCITKLDVLTGIDPLLVATSYRGPEGATFKDFPYHQSILHKATAEYEQLPGWEDDITGAREADVERDHRGGDPLRRRRRLLARVLVRLPSDGCCELTVAAPEARGDLAERLVAARVGDQLEPEPEQPAPLRVRLDRGQPLAG